MSSLYCSIEGFVEERRYIEQKTMYNFMQEDWTCYEGEWLLDDL